MHFPIFRRYLFLQAAIISKMLAALSKLFQLKFAYCNNYTLHLWYNTGRNAFNQLPLIQVLIYKEAARDQAPWPAGNPPIGGEGANSCPGLDITAGEYKLITMIQVNYFTAANLLVTPMGTSLLPATANGYMHMRCC